IVTAEGVVLIDSGGSRRGAEEIETAIRRFTEQPVKVVINSGGQDHRWFGNAYFRSKGARIIASRAAVADHKARFREQYNSLAALIGPSLEGTEPSFAEQTFEQDHHITLGETRIELYHRGAAHTPGDTLIWLPQQRVAFAGDVVYTERMLGVGTMSNSSSWLTVFEFLRDLAPLHVIPGHGRATTLEQATVDTYDYLVFLREAVAAHMEAGNGIETVGEIDQSPFSHLLVYEQIKGRNAQQVYQEMEWE
ncbi:MAG: MBL fold metallo-hydrolase, partial [Aliarcobacter sp.]